MEVTKFNENRKYRFITILLMLTLAPLGIYRLWSKEGIYTHAERITYTMISCVYMIALIAQFI